MKGFFESLTSKADAYLHFAITKGSEYSQSALQMIPALVNNDNALSAATAATGLAKDLIVPKIDQFFEAESERLQFADLLRDASETAGNGKPVIVLIDELDRCRPNYSVDLLERLKHYFAVEGIVFVLAVDKTQLCHAINGVYGEKFDSSTYLPRFFDEIFRLAKPDGAKYTKYCLTALDNSVAGGLLAGWFC